MKTKSCTICCGTVVDNTCRSCGWKDKTTLNLSNNAWFAIHLGILAYAVAYLNGSLI